MRKGMLKRTFATALSVMMIFGLLIVPQANAENLDSITAAYDKVTGLITLSSLEAGAGKYIVAGYGNNDALIEAKLISIDEAGDTIVSLNSHLDIAYAKIMLVNISDELLSLTDLAVVGVNPKVQLLPTSVITYMTTDFEEAADKLLKTRPCITEQLDVIIDWEAVDGALGYTFTLSTNPDYSEGTEYSTTTNSITLNNLYIGTEYFCKIISDNGVEITDTFITQDYAPRFITTDSVDNVRDMGGWITENGKKIKQGLIYRGATLSDDRDESLDSEGNPAYDANGNRKSNTNYLLNEEMLLSENDKNVLTNDLRIKSEIDLRSSGEKSGRLDSPLGSDVKYYDITINADSKEFTNIDKLSTIFKLMADENNYPIYFHCTGGNDRTGRIAYLLNGLLGVSEENLIRDWELSTFSWSMRFRNDGTYWDAFSQFIDLVDSYEGDTLSEKIENVMINTFGLTQEEVDNIKSIMLEA